MILTGEDQRTHRGACPSDTLSFIYLTWTVLESEVGEKPATNRMSHGTSSVTKCSVGGKVPGTQGRWGPTGAPRLPTLKNVGYVVDKLALGQIFSEFFGFPLSVSS
jgi:hypothetical protein